MPRVYDFEKRNVRRCPACWVEVASTEKVCHLCGACLCVSPDPKSVDRNTTCKTCGGKITRSKVEQRVGRERLMRR